MGDADHIELSIVVPVKDEEQSIPFLAREIDQAMADCGYGWECLWVDDGSKDRSLETIRGIVAANPRHRYISLARNQGQSAALSAAFGQVAGAIIATLDGDGQNDPADIPKMAQLIREGRYQVVHGYRQRRQDGLARKLASRLANDFRNFTTGKNVRDVGCSTRCFQAACAEVLPRFAGMHRFLPTFFDMAGFTWCELPVNHRPRLRGTSKYTINNRLWVGLADCFGVLWLRRRAIAWKIAERSGDAGPGTNK